MQGKSPERQWRGTVTTDTGVDALCPPAAPLVINKHLGDFGITRNTCQGEGPRAGAGKYPQDMCRLVAPAYVARTDACQGRRSVMVPARLPPALRPGAGPPIQGTSRARRDGRAGPRSAAGHQTSSRQVDALHKPSRTPCSGFRSHSGSDVTVHIPENISLNFVCTFLALGF